MAHLSMNSPLGFLTVFEERGALVAVEWGRAPDPVPSPLLAEATDQLDAYFGGRLRVFDLPLRPAGTVFQRTVWALMGDIPYGATRHLRRVRAYPGNRSPARRRRLRPQPHTHRHSVPQGGRRRRCDDRIFGRPGCGYQTGAFATGGGLRI